MNKLIWLRNDLRLDDNVLFKKAFESVKSNEAVHVVYAICDEQWEEHHVAPARRLLVLKTLQCLLEKLSSFGITLHVIDVGTFKKSPRFILDLSKELACDEVFIHYEIPLNERLRDKAANELFAKNNIKLNAYHGQCLLQPGLVTKDNGEYYQVFTPFKKRFLSILNVSAEAPIAWSYKQAVSDEHEKKLDASQKILDQLLSKYQVANDIANNYFCDEEKILKKLSDFCADPIQHYKDARDIPSVDGTSSLSSYLSVGSLSVRRASYEMQRARKTHKDNFSGFDTWLSELIWRDFYRHILFAYPRLSKGESFRPQYENMPWQYDEKIFTAWKAGQTGFPLVDAAMRQLNQTGWMHNRLRMLTAMFLSKYALHDWHLGEIYFMQNLVDGDFASNNGGWQWASSTGTDAAPYFRLMSPTRQAERFDVEAAFIKKYVPELRDVPEKIIIKKHEALHEYADYPSPVLNTKGARDRASAFFKQVANKD